VTAHVRYEGTETYFLYENLKKKPHLHVYDLYFGRAKCKRMGPCGVSAFVCSSSRIPIAMCDSRFAGLLVGSKAKEISFRKHVPVVRYPTKQSNFMHTTGPGVWGHGQGGAVSAFTIIVPLGGNVHCSAHQRLLPGELPRLSSLLYWNVYCHAFQVPLVYSEPVTGVVHL
jgi:hypothetical protein